MDQKSLAQEIHHRLIEEYGHPEWRPHLSPVAELVSTILSQNTNDTNRDRAFDRLRERYSTWEEVRDAPVAEIVETIKVAGLANQKGPRIKNALRTISQREGEITLDFLQEMSVDEAKSWLEDLNGVGPKTAAIVLLFALEMPAFPVDTHVHRVTGRVGIRPEKMRAAKTHDLLEELLENNQYYAAHLNIIRHGREICTARNPSCDKCPLQDICRYYQEEVK